MFRRSLAIVAMAGAIAASGAPPAGAQSTFRFAHTLSTADTHHKAALRFAELVEERTDGEVEIVVHPAGELGNDPTILEGIRLGTIDMGLAGNPFYTRFVEKFNVLDLPYLFSGYDHVYRVVDGEIGAQLLDELGRFNMEGLAFWEIGFRNVTNSVRPIREPADLEGLKIRTTPNPAHVKAFELLGAIPTPMPFTEVYLALETGTVDGQENPVGLIHAMRFFEVQDHLSLTKHAYTVSIVAINQGKFDALTEEQQTILHEAAREAALYQRDLNREIEGDALEAMKSAGMQVVEDIDIEPFQAIVTDAVKRDYVEKHGSDLVDAVTALQ